MSKYKTIAQAEAKILKLEEKQRNLQQNFDAQAAGNRQRVRQYEAEIDRLKAELNRPNRVTITERRFNARTRLLSDYEQQAYKSGLEDAGATIIPDPEPTNYDRLKTFVANSYEHGWTPTQVAAYLDHSGVTAPEETK